MAASTAAQPRGLVAAQRTPSDHPVEAVSPLSKELVIGLVGYAGAGCSTAARRLRALLEVAGYSVHRIQLSRLIHQKIHNADPPEIAEGPQEGIERLARAMSLQDLGDSIRQEFGNHAVATLGIKEIMRLRGGSDHGSERIAFLLDSLKHKDEVNLLRRVYDSSFRLVAVHCERATREARLIGPRTAVSKYRGAPERDVLRYMDRDEKDVGIQHGQQVRDAFYLADYFIDNNMISQDGQRLNADLQRFIDLLLGNNLVRPTDPERGIFHAHAAALQSACLSRQVGAALISPDGRLISTGTNDVPRFGGGIYSEDTSPDYRCFQWEFREGDLVFTGCHNTRQQEYAEAGDLKLAR